MIRLSIIVVAAFFLAIIGVQVYRLSVQQRVLEAQAEELESKTEGLTRENESIKLDLEYYANPKNLMKEFRSLFNYRGPDEELHIIVPRK